MKMVLFTFFWGGSFVCLFFNCGGILTCKSYRGEHGMFSFSKDAHLGHLTALVFCCWEKRKIFNSNILEWNTAYFKYSFRWQKNYIYIYIYIYIYKFPSAPVSDTERDGGRGRITRFPRESRERVMVILAQTAARPPSPASPAGRPSVTWSQVRSPGRLNAHGTACTALLGGEGWRCSCPVPVLSRVAEPGPGEL